MIELFQRSGIRSRLLDPGYFVLDGVLQRGECHDLPGNNYHSIQETFTDKRSMILISLHIEFVFCFLSFPTDSRLSHRTLWIRSLLRCNRKREDLQSILNYPFGEFFVTVQQLFHYFTHSTLPIPPASIRGQNNIGLSTVESEPNITKNNI